jgi:hypothetical protein
MAVIMVGAQLGVVHLNAGDMKIVFGRSETGLSVDIGARHCPPHCNVDIAWRPMALIPDVAAR